MRTPSAVMRHSARNKGWFRSWSPGSSWTGRIRSPAPARSRAPSSIASSARCRRSECCSRGCSWSRGRPGHGVSRSGVGDRGRDGDPPRPPSATGRPPCPGPWFLSGRQDDRRATEHRNAMNAGPGTRPWRVSLRRPRLAGSGPQGVGRPAVGCRGRAAGAPPSGPLQRRGEPRHLSESMERGAPGGGDAGGQRPLIGRRTTGSRPSHEETGELGQRTTEIARSWKGARR